MGDLTSVLPYIEKYAPDLAKLVPAPFGTLLSYGLSAIFGTTAGSSDDLASAIQADPNAEFKLKQFALEHQDLLAKLNSSNLQATLSDTANARQREIDEEKITGKRDWILEIISLTVVIGFFAMIFFIAKTGFDQSDHDVLFTLIGQLASGFMAVLAFFFGNTRNG